MELIGKSLGDRYEILEKLGSGGMAMVYKAKCRLLKRLVAVKILKQEFNQDEEFLERFEIEAQASASLSDPNIVSVYDVGFEKGMHYIVMEYVEGPTLKEYIKAKGKLAWRDAIKIALQITSALSLAHRNGIIHRDIKPQNIIINSEGIAKVTDFGIAKAVTSTTIRNTGTAIGSVHYISPEQAQGGYVDSKTDLYSLGIVIYEMLTGKLPFNGDNPVNIAMKHVDEEPENPYNLSKDIPESLSELVLKLLRKNPDERYKDSKELEAALFEIYSNQKMESDKVKDLSEESPTIMMNSIKNGENKVGNMSKADYKRKVAKQKDSHRDDSEKGSKKQKRKRNNRRIIIKLIIYLVIIFALAAGAIKGYETILNILNPDKEFYYLNDFTGMTLENAEKILDSNLENATIKYIEEYSDTVEKGIIIAQNKPVGKELLQTIEIEFIVSKGPEFIIIPDFVGSNYLYVEASLKSIDLIYEIKREKNDKVKANEVIRTEPAKGDSVDPGTKIIIYVSDGPEIEMVIVPDLTGMTPEQARKKLTDRKLVLGEYDPADLEKSEFITSQYPYPGDRLEEGEIVDIYFEILDTPSPTPTLTPTPSPSPTPKIYDKYEVTDTYNILSGDNYSVNEGDEEIKVYIEVEYTYLESAVQVVNEYFNLDTLPRTIEFTYDVLDKGETIVRIFINNEKVLEY